MKLLIKVFMSQETMDALLKTSNGQQLIDDGFALGVPVEIDNNLPFKITRTVYQEDWKY